MDEYLNLICIFGDSVIVPKDIDRVGNAGLRHEQLCWQYDARLNTFYDFKPSRLEPVLLLRKVDIL